MSVASSNLVRITVIEEAAYGVTPGSGNFSTVRFTSESLSGSPNTVESKQIRTDRLSSGQIVTGLDVGGNMGFELAKELPLDDFIASALYSDWTTQTSDTVDLTINVAARTITRATGSWATKPILKGDVITLGGFSNAVNNVQVMVTSVVSTTVIEFAGPSTMVDEVDTGNTVIRADKLVIGTTKKSFSMQKHFTDLTTKAINYRGMIVGSMDLNVAYGEIINGSFSFSGNDYEVVSASGDFMTDGRTIDGAATTNSMNGSVDMPFFASAATGTFGASDFDVKSVNLKLDNNLTAITAIGNIEPQDYSPGTAKIDIEIAAYLSDAAWAVIGKKLTQEEFALGFMVKNSGGFYGFYIPSLQVSFDDPSSGGQNQDIILNMSGQAKVGTGGISSLAIFRG